MPGIYPIDPNFTSSNDQVQNEMSTRRSALGEANYKSKYGFYNSFSGADIVAYIHIGPQKTGETDSTGAATETQPVLGVLGNLQTLSYSTFREVDPVRSLGKTYADAYTRGPRTIAGTLVWTVLDQHVLAEALKYAGNQDFDVSTTLVDQIPPFDIIVTFNNEYGDVATMGIYGIRIINEGSTFSIDDMITEQTNSFVAADIDMLHKGKPFKWNAETNRNAKTGSDILMALAKKRMSSHGSTII